MSLYESASATAKRIRLALKEAFPDLGARHFKVTSDTFSGGSSVSVHYEDYPTVKEVNDVTQRFKSNSYDGMNDMEEHHGYDELGFNVSGAGYISVTKNTSAKKQKLIDDIVANKKAKGYIPNESDHQDDYRQNRKVDELLNRDLFYMGDRRDIEGVTNEDLLNLTGNTKLYKEDFTSRVKKIKDRIKEEYIYSKPDDEATDVKLLSEIDNTVDKLVAQELAVMKFGEEVTNDKRVDILLSFEDNIVKRYMVNNKDLSVKDVAIMDGIIDIKPIRNEILSGVAELLLKYQEAGFKVKNVPKLLKPYFDMKKLEDLKIPDYDLERIPVSQVVSICKAEADNLVMLDIENGITKVTLTKEEETIFGLAFKSLVPRDIEFTQDEIKEVIKEVIVKKGELGLNFKANFKDVVSEIVSRHLDGRLEATFSQEQKEVYQNADVESKIESILDRAETRGFIINKSTFDITFQNELAKKVRWEKDYRDKAKYPDYRAFSDGAIDKIISESAIRSIDRTVFTSDEKEAIKNLVDNGLQPHLQSLISNNTEDFVRKNIKEELTKLEKNKEIRLLKSDVENHVETFLNTYVEEINKIIRNEVRYNLRGGSEEYDANMTGKGAEYLEMADTLDSVVDKYSQVRETAKELNDRKPEYKEMVKDVSTDSYESIANYNYQYSKGNITREEYINKTDEIINNAIEDIKDIENYKQPNEKVNKVLEENRILVESVVNERQALGFEFKDVAVVDAVLKSYFPNVINEQELTRESVLEKLARLGYRTHLTQLDLEVIIEKLQEEIRQSYSKERVERLAKSGEEANLYNEIVLEYGGEIANQKHVQKTQNANTEAVKEYIFQNLENMVDRKLSKFIGNIQVQEENKISKIEKEEVERFKASYMEKTNLDGSFFDDIDNLENTMLTLNDFIQSGKGTDKTIRTAIVKSLRKDVENLGVIEYRVTAEEMRAIHDRLAMDSYTHLASDEYFEKMVSVLDGKEYPMEDIFTFLNANSSNNGYYLDKVGRISDIQNWLQITGVYKNLLKFAKPLIDESDVGGLSDKALVVRYIKDATESLVKLTRTKVAGSKYLKEKDIVEILVGQSKDEYRNLVIAFGKKVESYNEDMTSDVKEISLDTHRLITEARDMEEDLADKTAVVLTEALSNQLSDAKKSAIVRENTQKLDKQIIDYIKDRLKMYSLNYQGNLTMENLIKINSGFEDMRQEYTTAISENKTATELEGLFVGFKQRIVDILNTILITMAEENTRVGQYGLVISKNGLSVKEKSNAVRITRSLFKLNPDGNENYPTEIAFGGKNYAVTLNHYILGIKAFNGDLGKYLMHNSVISNVYNISTEDVEEGRLTNNTEFVKIILNKIAGEIAGEGKLNDVISEQLVFKEISNNPSQDANSIFEEALENTIAKISEKKGIVFNKDYVLSNYKDNFNEIVLAIGTQLARINRVTKGDRKAIINFAEENITQTLTSLQTDLNSFELTFTEREMTEIRTRLNGTLSRYKDDKKLTNSFKETIITAWNNNTVPKDTIPKKANITFSDNLAKLREERTIKGIIERFIQTEREKGSVVYSVDVSPTMNKASIDGLTDRQLASKFSNAIQNIVATSNVDFTMADHQVLYSKLVVKDTVIDLCNRVNVRLFNHRVNQDENVDINSIINQEMVSTEQAFKESDVFKDLIKEIESEQNGTVEDVIFNGLNISEMIRKLKESELEIATKQTNKNVWGRYLLASQSYKTELEIRQAIMSGTISVVDALTGNRTYLITRDIVGYRELDGTLVKVENVDEQELKNISTNISPENMISRLQNGVARIVFQKVGNGESRVMFATRNPEVIEHYANLHSIKLTDKNGNKDRRFEQLNQDSIRQQLNGDYITVFSLDSKGFRTFKPSTLYSYDEEYNVPSFISFSKDFDTWEQTMEGNIPVFELNVDNQYIADELGEAVALRTNEVVANEVFEEEEILREEEQEEQEEQEQEIAHKIPTMLVYTHAKHVLDASKLLEKTMSSNTRKAIEYQIFEYITVLFKDRKDIVEKVSNIKLDGKTDVEVLEDLNKIKFSGSPIILSVVSYAVSSVMNKMSGGKVAQGYSDEIISEYKNDVTDMFIEKYKSKDGRRLESFADKDTFTPIKYEFYNALNDNLAKDLNSIGLFEYKYLEYLEVEGYDSAFEKGLKIIANEMLEVNHAKIEGLIEDYFTLIDRNIARKDATAQPTETETVTVTDGFTPSENDVTYKNINVNELIHLIQNNTVTVKFRKKPTKKVPEGELRELTGTRNLELIKERITELEQEQQDKVVTSIEKMNTKEFVAGELSKGTIGMFEYAINEGRQFTLARLISYQVEGGEEVVLEDVSEVIDNHTHFNPKAEETFVTKEDMYETLRNKVVRVTFEKADKNERVMYCTMNKDLLEKYFVRDLDKLKYNPDAEVKTSEENKAEQLDNGLFKVLDLEAQSFRSFKFDKVLPFNDLHKVSSWIEFEPEQMGWFEVLKGNANIKDLEDVGNRNAKETTTTLTTERTTLEAENNQNYVEANKILDSLEADYINRVRKESELRDKYSDNMARLDVALARVKDAEDLIREGKNVLKYNKQDLEIKAEQEVRLLSMSNGLNNVKTESVKSMKAVIKPKSDKDMTTVLLVEYEIVEGGIVYSGLEAVISNPRFLLNGVSYEVIADTTNSLHFGTGSVVKSPISAQLKKMMEVMAEKTFGNAKVQLSVLGSKLVDTDAKRLTRLHTLVQNNKDDLAKSKISITMHNATPDFPAHAKFETVDNGTKVVWQITPAYIYDEVNENILYVRQNPGSTSKEYEQYLENLARFLNSKPSKDKMKEAGIDLSSMQKLKILHALTSKAFNLRSAVK